VEIQFECIACGCYEHRIVGLPPLIRDSAIGYRVVSCLKCGLQSAYPLPTEAELRDEYCHKEVVDYPKHGPIWTVRKWLWHPVRDATMIHLISRFVQRGTLLDFGAGGADSTGGQARRSLEAHRRRLFDERS